MQLAVYMTAVLREKENKDATPAAMFFYHVDDPIVDKKGDPQQEVLKKQRVKGLVNKDVAVVRKLDHAFADEAGGGLLSQIDALKAAFT